MILRVFFEYVLLLPMNGTILFYINFIIFYYDFSVNLSEANIAYALCRLAVYIIIIDAITPSCYL